MCKIEVIPLADEASLMSINIIGRNTQECKQLNCLRGMSSDVILTSKMPLGKHAAFSKQRLVVARTTLEKLYQVNDSDYKIHKDFKKSHF